MVYEQGWDKNITHMQQDLLWFICKVMPAVQKRWKLFCVDDHEDYYDSVTASDNAFVLFIIKYYTFLPSGWKHQENDATMEDVVQAGRPLEEIEAVGNKDQATDSKKEKYEERQAIWFEIEYSYG